MINPLSDPLVENVIVDPVGEVVRLDATPEGVAIVTIDRPERRNALNRLAVEGLTQAFETLQGASGVRVVFLRGAGGHFCAGADLAEMKIALANWTEVDRRGDAEAFAALLRTIEETPAVTVALCQGAARGLGVGLAVACDLAVATADATFGFPEAKLGLLPAVSAPYVARAVGWREARRLLLTGEIVEAARAERIGLVGEVAADTAELDKAMDRVVDRVMTSAPGAVAEIKRLVLEMRDRPLDATTLEAAARRSADVRGSAEAREGVAAYLERRRPPWLD
ncbi:MULTISPECIES: enoyl-CoA hydratase-related protein [unclassified Phenylobacterium]|uniref:enoyl-CoA hydratase-related protein n=1 Tax=unclassified Phenylobacterium TaxID=2640670 RepID=UPI0009E6CD2B|nr:MULTISPECIES: enoyl-CoA hydratase-related protein [unclassified Phenylobacterium]